MVQTIVAVPIIVLTETFGYTPFQPLNAFLAAFGFFSLFVAMFNLIPVPPLDGAVAWRLLPALFSAQGEPQSANPVGDLGDDDAP